MNFTKVRNLLFVIFLFSITLHGQQDTLVLRIGQADSIFLKNSFYLLAANMNVEAQKAQIIQAKLYPNPTFTANLNAYDPENDIFFHIGETGQKEFQLEQLILLGGKRKAEIEMAKTNVAIAELEFTQLTRNLKYELYRNLYAIGQQEVLLQKYNEQLGLIDGLLDVYKVQVEKGNIPLKELVRLKGAYLKLNQVRAELLNDYYSTQAIVQSLLQVSDIVRFSFVENDIFQYIKPVSLEELKQLAKENKPDLLIIQQNKQYADQYLKYQRRMAVPDVGLFTSYDQQSGAFKNEINAGISLQLPLWNRNQGNIKSAEYKLKESDYQMQIIQNEMIAELQNLYAYYIQSIAEYNKANELYNIDFEVTIKGMTDNFQKRNISIVEFIDFFESYNEVLTELMRIKTQLVTTAESLNLLVGIDIF